MGAVTAPPVFGAPTPIEATHETAAFTCGKAALDDWLKTRALKSEGRSARTYVVCAGNSVAAYYCLATGSVRRAERLRRLAGDVPDHVPIIVIGRLAVDSRFQGMRLGKHPLKDALLRALQVSRQVGCRAVLVHAIDEDAAAFYAAYSFVRFPAASRTFFMPVKQIAAAI